MIKKIKKSALALCVLSLALVLQPTETEAFKIDDEKQIIKLEPGRSLILQAKGNYTVTLPISTDEGQPLRYTEYDGLGQADGTVNIRNIAQSSNAVYNKTVTNGEIFAIWNDVWDGNKTSNIYVDLSGVDLTKLQVINDPNTLLKDGKFRIVNDSIYEDGNDGYHTFIALKDITMDLTVKSIGGSPVSHDIAMFNDKFNFMADYGLYLEDVFESKRTNYSLPVKKGHGFDIYSNGNYVYVTVDNLVFGEDYIISGYNGYEGTFTYGVPDANTEGVLKGTSTIVGGPLSLAISSDSFEFPTLTLKGATEMLATTLPKLRITDHTGTAAGWKVTIEATPFVEVEPSGGFKSGTSAKTLSDNITLSTGALKGVDGSSITGITLNQVRQNIVGNEMVLASAAANSGMGTYDIEFAPDALKVNIPTDKPVVDKVNYPGEQGTPYTTKLTVKLVSGP